MPQGGGGPGLFLELPSTHPSTASGREGLFPGQWGLPRAPSGRSRSDPIQDHLLLPPCPSSAYIPPGMGGSHTSWDGRLTSWPGSPHTVQSEPPSPSLAVKGLGLPRSGEGPAEAWGQQAVARRCPAPGQTVSSLPLLLVVFHPRLEHLPISTPGLS